MSEIRISSHPHYRLTMAWYSPAESPFAAVQVFCMLDRLRLASSGSDFPEVNLNSAVQMDCCVSFGQ